MSPYAHFLITVYCEDSRQLLRYAVSVDMNSCMYDEDFLPYWAEPDVSTRILSLLPEEDASSSHVLVDFQPINGVVSWGKSA